MEDTIPILGLQIKGRSLKLTLPKVRAFVERNGQEIDIVPNMRVEKDELLVIQRGYSDWVF